CANAESHFAADLSAPARAQGALTALARYKIAHLDVRTVRVGLAQGRADPALLVPAVEWRILTAGQFRFQLLQGGARFANQLPHPGGVWRAQSLFQQDGRLRLLLGHLQAKADVDGKEPLFGERHAVLGFDLRLD